MLKLSRIGTGHYVQRQGTNLGINALPANSVSQRHHHSCSSPAKPLKQVSDLLKRYSDLCGLRRHHGLSGEPILIQNPLVLLLYR
jgi:hypothetical protein